MENRNIVKKCMIIARLYAKGAYKLFVLTTQ